MPCASALKPLCTTLGASAKVIFVVPVEVVVVVVVDAARNRSDDAGTAVRLAAVSAVVRGHLELAGVTTADALAVATSLPEGRVAFGLAALEQEGFAMRGRYTEEAVEDPVGPNTSGPKNDPVRVLRGGSWREGGVSASYRKPRDPIFYRMNFIGIRVVLDP